MLCCLTTKYSENRDDSSRRFLPQSDDLHKVAEDDRFEVAAPEARPEVTYGLTTMGDAKGKNAGQSNGDAAAADGPRGRGRRVIGTGLDWEKEAFKTDVDALPNESSLEEYEAMPVEAFGAAMLRGMGWSEEQDTTKVSRFPMRMTQAAQGCF